jgi:hypothetical protein
MRDYLLDLVEHTFDLGCIDLVKIVGTDSATQIVAVSDDQSVVVLGNYSNPVADFIGTFGMPNLSKLKTLLSLQEYRENAKLTMSRRADSTPDGVNFENHAGDFKNNYRFMSSTVITEKLKTPKFAGANWNITFEPTNAAIQRLKWQMAANVEEPSFTAKTDGSDLKFSFGDHSSHSGSFVFHPGVNGTLKRSWAWPAKQFASIMDLTGDKTVQISDDGAAQITVDSGLAVYKYILPAQSK